MSLSLYIYIYTYVCMFIYIYIYMYMYICIYTHPSSGTAPRPLAPCARRCAKPPRAWSLRWMDGWTNGRMDG